MGGLAVEPAGYFKDFKSLVEGEQDTLWKIAMEELNESFYHKDENYFDTFVGQLIKEFETNTAWVPPTHSEANLD